MRNFTPIIFLLLIQFAIAKPDAISIPKVPSSITIADVKLKITPEAQAEIQKDVNALRASEKYFKIKLDRINLYFPIIEKALKEEGIPDDIKYLSVQESSLISDAVSSADAVGYWQFKDFTAREVGLRVDGKIDERKNIAAASRGAAKYFKRNNYFVKNWLYAVSAYQAGPSGVKRYVDQKYVDTGKLTIDKNSHWYAKRFIAHVIAFRDEIGKPHSEGVYLQEYTKGQGKSISDISKEYKIDEDELEKYNKWLRSGKIPDDKEYIVIIPLTGKAPKIINEKDKTPIVDPPPLTRETTSAKPEKIVYPDEIVADLGKSKVIFEYNGINAIISRKGDNKESLSKRGNIDKKRFDKYNEMLPGQPLPENEIYYLSKKKSKSAIAFHVAKQSESLWTISQRYGVKVKKLEKFNREERATTFKAGRVIYLKGKRPAGNPEFTKVIREDYTPVKKENKKAPVIIEKSKKANDVDSTSNAIDLSKLEKKETKKAKTKEPEFKEDKTTYDIHVVKSGESLWAVANKYNVSVSQLLEWNGMFEGEVISPGQNLQIGAPVEVSVSRSVAQIAEVKSEIEDAGIEELSSQTTTSGIHVVKTGETLYGIAELYNMEIGILLALNDLEAGSPLTIGQELFVAPDEDLPIVPEKEDEVLEGQSEEEAPTETSSKERTHIVSKGETLYGIARQYDMTVPTLLELNNLDKSSALSVGQRLLLSSNELKDEATPIVEEVIDEPVLTVEDQSTDAEKSNQSTHTVVAGETLYGIARNYKLSVNELISLNELEKNSDLSIGQKLLITSNAIDIAEDQKVVKEQPTDKQSESTEKSNNGKHVVGSGETLYGIATQYEISVKELLAWNSFEPNTPIKPGQSINIRQPKTEIDESKKAVDSDRQKEETENKNVAAPSEGQYQTHIVRGGDTLYDIAAKYGMTINELKKLNNKKESSLSVGEELKVKK